MGWTSYYRTPGQTDLDHFREELFGPESRYELLDGMTVHNVFYGAMRCPDGHVTALVVLQHRNRGHSRYDGSNYARKEMTESMGPAEDRCPARILALLTDPPENEYAAQWRERCRENLAKRAAQVALKVGDTFRVVTPWTFADDVQADTFQLVDGKRKIFRRDCDGARVRLPARDHWPAYEVVR